MVERFAKQLVSAVVALHRPINGELVIHRDIKMDNILIEIKSNNEPILKLADFGCAVIIKNGERVKGQNGTICKCF